MTVVPDHLRATEDRFLPARARCDLDAVSVMAAGQGSVVLRDSLSLEMHHLSQEEYFLFDQLKQQSTLAELKRRFETRFAPRTVTTEALHQAIYQMEERGLVVSTANGQGERLLERADERRRHDRWQHLISLLSFRLAHWDATAVVDKLYVKLSWIFSPVVAVVIALSVGYALWILMTHGAEVAGRLPTLNELTQPRLWPVWLATIAFAKMLHELGHALTCRHFGGRCHEMGIMLLALLPCAYCDVTDTWRFPNKWHRIAVSAAGIVVEMTLAALAIIGWWHTEPGWLHTWLLGVTIICSVGTLAVNANPLLRYDGYYILSDWLEIPNLAGRAQVFWQDRIQKWLLGETVQPDPLLTACKHRRVAWYALASKLYSWVVLVAIFAMLLKLARSVHLENLVFTLAALTLSGFIFVAARGQWLCWRNPANRARMRRGRALGLFLIWTLLLLSVLFFPISHTVTGTVALVPADAVPLYASVPGHLLHALPAGTWVEAGEVVAQLTDPDLQLELVRQQADVAVKRAHYRQLNTLRAINPRTSGSVPTAQAALQNAMVQCEQQRQLNERLVLRAPQSGTVIAPPRHESESDATRLPSWKGDLLDAKNRNCWVEEGTEICSIGDRHRLKAIVAIDERDIAEVQSGDQARIQLATFPTTLLTGEVTRVASRATIVESDTSHTDPRHVHTVELRLDSQDEFDTLVGARGRARIAAESTTLWQLATRFLRAKLRLPW